MFTVLHDLLDESEKGLFESGRKRLSGSFSKLDKTTIRKELERFIIELSWKSSQIEGNTYTLLETEELIKNKKEAAGHDRSEAVMILNHKRVFDVIMEYKEAYKDVSLHDLKMLHSVLTEGLDVPSGLRRRRLGIMGTRYTPLDNEHRVREALDKLFDLVSDSGGGSDTADYGLIHSTFCGR